MIELKDVNFKYKNGDMVLKDINLKIHEKSRNSISKPRKPNNIQ